MTKKILLAALVLGCASSNAIAAGWVTSADVAGKSTPAAPAATASPQPDTNPVPANAAPAANDGIAWIDEGMTAGVRPRWNNDYQHPDIHDLAAEVAGWEGHKATHSHTVVVKPPRQPHYALSHMMTSYEMGNGWSVPVSHDPHTRVVVDWRGEYPGGRYSAPMVTPYATVYTSTPGCSASEEFRQVNGCPAR